MADPVSAHTLQEQDVLRLKELLELQRRMNCAWNCPLSRTPLRSHHHHGAAFPRHSLGLYKSLIGIHISHHETSSRS